MGSIHFTKGGRTIINMQTQIDEGVRYYRAQPSPSPDNPRPIVLVHGLGTSLDFWNAVAPRLAKRSVTVALDLPGSGDSLPPEGTYNLDTVANGANEFLDRQGLTNTTLVGHSLGALVALKMAEQRGDLTSKLVLVDPTLFEVEAVLTRFGAAVRNPKLFGITFLQFLGGLRPL